MLLQRRSSRILTVDIIDWISQKNMWEVRERLQSKGAKEWLKSLHLKQLFSTPAILRCIDFKSQSFPAAYNSIHHNVAEVQKHCFRLMVENDKLLSLYILFPFMTEEDQHSPCYYLPIGLTIIGPFSYKLFKKNI